MSNRTNLIGERIARAAQSYGELRRAVERLDAAKQLHPKGSPLAEIGGEVSDHTDMFLIDRYLAIFDSANSLLSSTTTEANRVAGILERAKP
jgi:hypothetical protein